MKRSGARKLETRALVILSTCLIWGLLAASAQAAGPAVTSISPTSGSTLGGTSVTITGTGLAGASAVDFGGTAGTITANPTDASVTATSPPGTGTVDVTVTSSGGGPSATSNNDQFTYVTPVTPVTTTTLSATPTSAVTNEVVTMSATVFSTFSGPSGFSGSIAFENGGVPIGGCGNIAVQPQAPSTASIATCQASFAASPSPEQLTAVFTPSQGLAVSGSSSSPVAVTVGKDGTSTSLQVSAAKATIGQGVTYSATVAAKHPGPFRPTGPVEFFDDSTPIATCLADPVITTTSGATASCKVSYSKTGTHHVSALYSGNGKFSGSTSAPASINTTPLPLLGAVTTTMQWTFYYTPTYTRILGFLIQDAPVGATVLVLCHGHGCPFSKLSTPISKPKPCKQKAGNKCPSRHTGLVDLVTRFHNHRLMVGARIAVEILRPRYVGKYYVFVVRPHQAPRIQITCLAPGATRPGVGCG